VESASNIAKDPLQGCKVRLTRIMHVKTDLLNCICNVWQSKHQVLKSSSKAAKVCSIRHWGPINCSNLRVGVNWSGAWLHSVIPARSRMSSIYCRCERRRPSLHR
jgi:hypothetical protein